MPTSHITRGDAAQHVTDLRQLFIDRYSFDRDRRRSSYRRIKERLAGLLLLDAVLAGHLQNECHVAKQVQGLLTGGPSSGSLDEALPALVRRRGETDAWVASLPAAEPAPAT